MSFIVSMPASRSESERSFILAPSGERVDTRSRAWRFDTVAQAHDAIAYAKKRAEGLDLDDLRARLELARVERADLVLVATTVYDEAATAEDLAKLPNALYVGTQRGDYLVGFATVEVRGDIGNGESDCTVTVAIEHVEQYGERKDCYLLWVVEQYDDESPEGEDHDHDGEWFSINKYDDADLLPMLEQAVSEAIDPDEVEREREDDRRTRMMEDRCDLIFERLTGYY